MASKRLGKFICVAALAGLAFAVPAIAGCKTQYPEANVKIEYNGVSYTLKYKLYSNMYPQTVKHFIELADNKFYDNTIVHDYSSSSYMRCGGYSYLEDEEYSYSGVCDSDTKKDNRRDYLEKASKEYEYSVLADPEAGKITPSVYRDVANGKYVDPLNTLIGEFSNNQHKIENGALSRSYGCLSMFYTPKNSLSNQRVRLDKYGSDFGVQGDYKNNSTTSLFSIQLSNSTSADSAYCIFGKLENTNKLKDLAKAITDNKDANARREVSEFYIDLYDEFVGGNRNTTTTHYYMPQTPIIIKSVRITKY